MNLKLIKREIKEKISNYDRNDSNMVAKITQGPKYYALKVGCKNVLKWLKYKLESEIKKINEIKITINAKMALNIKIKIYVMHNFF